MMGVRLTTCASAAGDHVRAPTNLRSTARSRSSPPARRAAPVRPVGCMRGLGGALAGNSGAQHFNGSGRDHLRGPSSVPDPVAHPEPIGAFSWRRDVTLASMVGSYDHRQV
jgi:hypothetical protein